jgi:hypothetical protein
MWCKLRENSTRYATVIGIPEDNTFNFRYLDFPEKLEVSAIYTIHSYAPLIYAKATIPHARVWDIYNAIGRVFASNPTCSISKLYTLNHILVGHELCGRWGICDKVTLGIFNDLRLNRKYIGPITEHNTCEHGFYVNLERMGLFAKKQYVVLLPVQEHITISNSLSFNAAYMVYPIDDNVMRSYYVEKVPMKVGSDRMPRLLANVYRRDEILSRELDSQSYFAKEIYYRKRLYDYRAQEPEYARQTRVYAITHATYKMRTICPSYALKPFTYTSEVSKLLLVCRECHMLQWMNNRSQEDKTCRCCKKEDNMMDVNPENLMWLQDPGCITPVLLFTPEPANLGMYSHVTIVYALAMQHAENCTGYLLYYTHSTTYFRILELAYDETDWGTITEQQYVEMQEAEKVSTRDPSFLTDPNFSPIWGYFDSRKHGIPGNSEVL